MFSVPNIYYEKDHIKQMFIKTCKDDPSEEEISKVTEKRYVVLYDNSNAVKLFGLGNSEAQGN